MSHPTRRVRIPSFLTQTSLAALLALAACNGDNQSNGSAVTGGADLSVHQFTAFNPSSVVATVSGPALPAPKTFSLSARGSSGTWGALIGALPVGSNYVFTVSASDQSNPPVNYGGTASNVAIIKDQVTAVIIVAQQSSAPTPFKNAVPVIDSLVLSSTNVVPGASITAKATAHDPNAGDTIAFAWSASPGPDGFVPPRPPQPSGPRLPPRETRPSP
jgi:hypothetical protein